MKKQISMITLCLSLMAHARNGREYDVVVYGGSPAAISAAVQVKRMGLECVVVCPDKRIGGQTTGRLGQTDIGNKNAFGGIASPYRSILLNSYCHAWSCTPSYWLRRAREEGVEEGTSGK